MPGKDGKKKPKQDKNKKPTGQTPAPAASKQPDSQAGQKGGNKR